MSTYRLLIALLLATIYFTPAFSQDGRYQVFDLDFSQKDGLGKIHNSILSVRLEFNPVTKSGGMKLDPMFWFQETSVTVTNNSCFDVDHYFFRFLAFNPNDREDYEYLRIGGSESGSKLKRNDEVNFHPRLPYSLNKVELREKVIIPTFSNERENEETIKCLGYSSKEAYDNLVRQKDERDKLQSSKEKEEEQKKLKALKNQRKADKENQDNSHLEWLNSFEEAQEILDFYSDKTKNGIFDDVPLKDLVFAGEKLGRGIIVFNSFNGTVRELNFNLNKQDLDVIEGSIIIADYSKHRVHFDTWIRDNNQQRFSRTPTLLYIEPNGRINILYQNPSDYMIVSPYLLKNYLAMIKASEEGSRVSTNMERWEGKAIRKSISILINQKLEGYKFFFNEFGTLTEILEYENGEEKEVTWVKKN